MTTKAFALKFFNTAQTFKYYFGDTRCIPVGQLWVKLDHLRGNEVYVMLDGKKVATFTAGGGRTYMEGVPLGEKFVKAVLDSMTFMVESEQVAQAGRRQKELSDVEKRRKADAKIVNAKLEELFAEESK